MRFLLRLFKQRRAKERLFVIGPHEIHLAAGSMVDVYQRKFPRYDFILGEIARIVFQHVPPELGAIDIGANVGDSAALINKYLTIPTLCIEGLDEFLVLLERNRRVLGDHVQIEPSFLGTGEEVLSPGASSTAGTFSPLSSPAAAGARTRTLQEVLARHPQFSQAKLIKLDTDGFDFKILRNSMDVIAAMQPVLFFEYDICFERDGAEQARDAVSRLQAAGYKRFVAYDNCGNFLLSFEDLKTLDDLNLFLLSNAYHAVRTRYLDLCAFPDTEAGSASYQDLLRYEHGQRDLYLSKLPD